MESDGDDDKFLGFETAAVSDKPTQANNQKKSETSSPSFVSIFLFFFFFFVGGCNVFWQSKKRTCVTAKEAIFLRRLLN